MAGLRFTVLTSSWAADGQTFLGGPNEVAKPSKELLKLAAGAHAAGDIKISEGFDAKHVQTQAAGEKALAAAMGKRVEPDYNPDGTRDPGRWDGPWYEGHLDQFIRDAEQRLANPELDDGTRVYLETGVASAREQLKKIQKEAK